MQKKRTVRIASQRRPRQASCRRPRLRASRPAHRRAPASALNPASRQGSGPAARLGSQHQNTRRKHEKLSIKHTTFTRDWLPSELCGGRLHPLHQVADGPVPATPPSNGPSAWRSIACAWLLPIGFLLIQGQVAPGRFSARTAFPHTGFQPESARARPDNQPFRACRNGAHLRHRRFRRALRSRLLSLDAKQTRQFNSQDLEEGDVSRGLPEGVGDGRGDWRLELHTDLDIEPLAYVRTDASLGSVHDTVPEEAPTRYPACLLSIPGAIAHGKAACASSIPGSTTPRS